MAIKSIKSYVSILSSSDFSLGKVCQEGHIYLDKSEFLYLSITFSKASNIKRECSLIDL